MDSLLIEAGIIGVFAALLGMLIAFATSNAINYADLMMPAPPGRSEGYPIYIYISWFHYAMTSLVFIIIAALASVVATYGNAKVNIADALS